jgi:hypothetical protein
MDWFNDSEKYPAPGTIVSVRAFVFWRHKGIVSDQRYGGKPTVIASSPILGTREETWDRFRSGQEPVVEGYPSNLPYHEVVRRARSRIGTDYDLLGSNCDHLANYAHDLPMRSEQLLATVGIAVLAGVIVAGMAKK